MEGSAKEDQALIGILDDLERRLKKRVPLVIRRSPETLLEELEALELIVDLKKKLG